MFQVIAPGEPYPIADFDHDAADRKGFVKLRFRDYSGRRHVAFIEGDVLDQETFDRAQAEATAKGAVRGEIEGYVVPPRSTSVRNWAQAHNLITRT